ncbi:hypothetical protein ACP70R_007479 [Stipagrostis hirtigluma subsp. patula]
MAGKGGKGLIAAKTAAGASKDKKQPVTSSSRAGLQLIWEEWDLSSQATLITYNNTMISFNMLEAATINDVKGFFYASSACIYPEFKQLEILVSLKESDAWSADHKMPNGLEKLATEELCKHYTKDFGIECRIGRFHNIYGPFGAWKGGREKAPAAFCRKALTSTGRFEMWGDGLQTRSFTFIDECAKGVLSVNKSLFSVSP